MRKYELTLIFKKEEEAFARGLESVKNEFKKEGVTVTKEEKLGIKELAYDIKKESKANYYYVEADADPAKIVSMERSFRLNDDLLKFLFVKVG